MLNKPRRIAIYQSYIKVLLPQEALDLMISEAFSATAYTVVCKWVAGINGMIDASTTESLLVP